MRQQPPTLHPAFENAVFTLWTSDIWLTRDSFRLAGVFSQKANAIHYARKKALLSEDGHVVIHKGRIDDYEATEEQVFSTQNARDKAALIME